MATIPQTAIDINRLKELIPSSLHRFTWIAGSAACRWPLNGDVDAWILPPDETAFSLAREIENLPGNHVNNARGGDDQDGEMYAGGLMAWTGEGLHILVGLVGQTINQTLAGFDVSCHQAAVPLLGGQMVVGDGYTAHAVRLLPGVHNAQKSVRRLFKFAERYNEWTFFDDDSVTSKAVIDAFGLPTLPWEMYNVMRRARVAEGL